MLEIKNILIIYDLKEFEDRIYKIWEEKGYFILVIDKNKKLYIIIMLLLNIIG